MSGWRMIAAALIAVSVAASPMRAAPARDADWQHMVSATADGGFRMGNPKAKIVIVEYGSLTCPHCRHFAETAMKPLLDNYVRTGKASFEFRTFVLNPVDQAATLIARCGGASHFFPIAEKLYATQLEWAGKTGELPDAELARLDALPQGQKMVDIAKVSGLVPVAAAHGISQAKAETCLKDEAAANALTKFEQESADAGVPGTPYILVNGTPTKAFDWASLEPYLKDAGG